MLSTPIINPRNRAIHGYANIGNVRGENGEVVVPDYVPWPLSYDHRIIDGRNDQ